MELLLLVVVVGAVGVLGPLLAWSSEEHQGRGNWTRIRRATETFSLGLGAFRGTSVAVHHDSVLRDRAPWWLRLLAFTCYLLVGVAILSGLPWLVGVLFLVDRSPNMGGFDAYTNALLVAVYPFGCWAAVRMSTLGGALMSGDATRFRDALRGASLVVVPLNAAILLGAFALALRFPHSDAWLLAVTPLVALLQLGGVAAAGRQVDACAAACQTPDGSCVADAQA